MDTKAAFEKFLQRKGISCEHWDATDESYGYVSEDADALLEVWLESWAASRAAIEIELDRIKNPLDDAFADGYNDALDDIERKLTSHGIRIKGKTE